MDYEKKYKEGVEWLRDWIYLATTGEMREQMEKHFPELKESDDEKIRKNLIGYIKGISKNEVCEETKDSWIAWLEKQGEKQQKVSTWKHWKDGIAGNGEGKQIYLIKDGYMYSISSCLGFECDYIELSELDKLLSEKQGEQKPDKVEPKFKVGDKVYALRNRFECTIESIDETTYYGDTTNFDIKDQDSWKLVGQKSAWSEEDETMITDLSVIAHTYFSEISGIPFKYDLSEDKIRTWLKSLKDRALTQPKLEWNEEDEDILNTIINHFEIDLECTKNDDIIKWLKSLKPQNKWKPSDEQMKVLKELVEDNNQRYFYTLLRSLYDQLKILKGE